MVIRIDSFKLRPNCEPRKPVAKHDVFMTPLAQSRAMDSSSVHETGRLSSGRLRSMASDSTPNLASICASKSRSLANNPPPPLGPRREAPASAAPRTVASFARPSAVTSGPSMAYVRGSRSGPFSGSTSRWDDGMLR